MLGVPYPVFAHAHLVSSLDMDYWCSASWAFGTQIYFSNFSDLLLSKVFQNSVDGNEDINCSNFSKFLLFKSVAELSSGRKKFRIFLIFFLLLSVAEFNRCRKKSRILLIFLLLKVLQNKVAEGKKLEFSDFFLLLKVLQRIEYVNEKKFRILRIFLLLKVLQKSGGGGGKN